MLKLILGIAYLVAIAAASEVSVKNLAAYVSDTLTQAPSCPGPNEFIKCDQISSRYRTYDGTCNNLLYPWWGAAQTPYNRLLKPPATCNGTAPRTNSEIDLNGLPSVVEVSHLLAQDDSTYSSLVAMYPFFAVFVSHDLFSTMPEYVDCECGSKQAECFNIRLSTYFQEHYYRECINYVRNLDSRKVFDCMFDHREQISNVSHWLDLSNLYGSNYEQARNFRVYKDGLLRFDRLDNDDLDEILPIVDINQCLKEEERTLGCFYGPDQRAFQTPSVTVIYIIFLREHNRIATELKELNSHWSDETLFQEARRITIAIYQHIVYNELLKTIIGEDLVKAFNLIPLKNGHGNFYNDYLYANIYNEFATAAFPLINYLPSVVIKDFDGYDDLMLSETWWRQDLTYGDFHKLVVALFTNKANDGGFTISSSIIDLFLESPIDMKNNLPALILQQGRDNALQSYVEYRALVGLGSATGWDTLSNIAYSTMDDLRSLFSDIDEIDLFIGMLAENLIDGAYVGRTQGFIIAKQFSLLKFADRHFYENGEDYVNRFTEDQLHSIRKYTGNRLICNNLDLESELLYAALFCGDLTLQPDIDLSLWKEISKVPYYY